MNASDRLFTRCPICSTSDIATSGIDSYEGELLRCPHCDLLMNNCDIDRYNRSNAGWDTEEGTSQKGIALHRMQKRSTKLLGRVQRLLDKQVEQTSILDVGCSSGDFLLAAKSLGYRVEGVEPSEKAARQAKDRGIKTFAGLLSDAGYRDESFDIITMFNVIEHIDKPVGLISEAFRILNHSGVLVLETGNTDSWTMQVQQGKWLMFDMDRQGGHVCFYNQNSMRRLCEKAGFVYKGISTKNVRLVDKKKSHRAVYRLASLAHELLQYPSQLMNKGHDMTVFFIKP